MERREHPRTGAVVERGEIAEVTDNGYRVKNLDRRGLTSREITGTLNETFAVGDMVLFIMFADGGGKILCRS